jgi:hypothetical protein
MSLEGPVQVNKIPLTVIPEPAPDKAVKVKEHNVRDSSTISISLIYQVFLLFFSYITFPWVVLSLAGDLLRTEQNREGSQYGDLIRTYIREGTIVPMQITMKLLENAMQAILNERTTGDGWENGCGRFLIDGFPRKMDQAIGFDEQVGIIVICIFDSFSSIQQ